MEFVHVTRLVKKLLHKIYIHHNTSCISMLLYIISNNVCYTYCIYNIILQVGSRKLC